MILLFVTLQAFPSGDRKATNYMIPLVIVSSFNGTLQYLNV